MIKNYPPPPTPGEGEISNIAKKTGKDLEGKWENMKKGKKRRENGRNEGNRSKNRGNI